MSPFFFKSENLSKIHTKYLITKINSKYNNLEKFRHLAISKELLLNYLVQRAKTMPTKAYAVKIQGKQKNKLYKV